MQRARSACLIGIALADAVTRSNAAGPAAASGTGQDTVMVTPASRANDPIVAVACTTALALGA